MSFEVDPDEVARVNIVVSASSSAFISEMSFGHWILCQPGDSPAIVKAAIETPLAALLGATTSDGLRFVMDTQATIIRTDISKPLLDPQPVPDETTRSLAGGVSGGLMPPDIAMVVSFRTTDAGPAFRGRTYVPGISIGSMQTSGLFTSSKCSALATDWNTYIAALQSLGTAYPQITLSRYHNVGGIPVLRATPLASTVQVATVDVHADTQRRRGVR